MFLSAFFVNLLFLLLLFFHSSLNVLLITKVSYAKNIIE